MDENLKRLRDEEDFRDRYRPFDRETMGIAHWWVKQERPMREQLVRQLVVARFGSKPLPTHDGTIDDYKPIEMEAIKVVREAEVYADAIRYYETELEQYSAKADE